MKEELALFTAAERGEIEEVRLLVAGGVDIKVAKASNGCTAFHFAAMNGHEEVVKVLLEADLAGERGQKGMAARHCNRNGYTALDLAGERGHKGVARLLRDAQSAAASANRGAGGVRMASALCRAVERGEILEFWRLMADGADAAAKDGRGFTALHLAGIHGRENVVKGLLNEGAELSATDSNGHSALELATKHGFPLPTCKPCGGDANPPDPNDASPSLHQLKRLGNG